MASDLICELGDIAAGAERDHAKPFGAQRFDDAQRIASNRTGRTQD
jgi:hypothetical protein